MVNKDNSSPLVVEKSEVVLVKPSKPTPYVSLSLSTIDNEPNYETINKTLCVYAPIPYLQDLASHDLASLIQNTLSHALFYYYPLAGKLHRKSDDYRLQLNCKAGDGVPFISATAACTLASLNYLDSVGDAAYQLVPCCEPVNGSEEYDPLALQVTRFACGGITIGVANSHAVCDGVGIAQIFRAMIELVSGKTQPTVIPVWERERLTFKDMHFNGKLGHLLDVPNAGSSYTDDMVQEILNITSEDITKLKKMIVEDEQVTNEQVKMVEVTTLEILAAQVWRARCRALNMSPQETTNLAIVIGIRSIMEPPLPEGYYGNAFVNGFVTLTAKELSESSLSRVVRLIKDMKRAVDKQYVLEHLNHIERRLEMRATMEMVDIGSMVLTDWRQIGLNYSFWGGFVNIIPLVPTTNPLLCILLPGVSGGVRLLVTLPRDAMAKFKEEMNAF